MLTPAELKQAIDDAHEASAILDLAIFTSENLSELVDREHVQVIASLGRCLERALKDVSAAIEALAKIERERMEVAA